MKSKPRTQIPHGTYKLRSIILSTSHRASPHSFPSQFDFGGVNSSRYLIRLHGPYSVTFCPYSKPSDGSLGNKPCPDVKVELRKDMPVPKLKSNEILVKIQYSGSWYGTPNRSHPVTLDSLLRSYTDLVVGPATSIFTTYPGIWRQSYEYPYPWPRGDPYRSETRESEATWATIVYPGTSLSGPEDIPYRQERIYFNGVVLLAVIVIC